MKQTIVLICSIILICNYITGQNFKKQFNDLVSKKDNIGQIELLQKWEKADSNDAELFVAYFNYYINKSRSEIIGLGKDPKGEYDLQIMDQDTIKKEPIGFIYSDSYYNPEFLNKGFDWINKGIIKYPNRLDMRFGKIYLLGLIEDYELFTIEIINTIEYSTINKNSWTWADNKPVDNPKNFMLSSIQDYQVQLYDTQNDSLLSNMKRIAETILKYYPDHIESLSNLSVVFMFQKLYDEALVVLLKAENLNPKDYIVLNNIAQAYKLKGDKKNAIKYYELTIKYGNEQVKQHAEEQIKVLEKK